MTADTATQAAPQAERLIEERLFRLDERGQPRLIGCRCKACGGVFGGRRQVCLACFGRELEEHLLSPRGTVQSFTTVHQAPRSAILTAPYTIVQVRLPEGVVVTSPLVESDPTAVAIGQAVETKAIRFKDEAGQTVVTYAFVPSN